MVCAPVRPIIPSLKLGEDLSVQAHKPCSIYHVDDGYMVYGTVIIAGSTYQRYRDWSFNENSDIL